MDIGYLLFFGNGGGAVIAQVTEIDMYVFVEDCDDALGFRERLQNKNEFYGIGTKGKGKAAEH